MIVTLYGPDSYRRLKKLNELIASAVEKRGGYSHERFSLINGDDFARLKNFINTPSMFSSKRLVILDNPFDYSKSKELKEVLKSSADREDVNIIINTEKKFTSSFKFLTEAPNKFEEYKKLEGRELDKFIGEEAKKLGIKLDSSDLGLVKEAFGSDTWRIVTELEKVALASGRGVEGKSEKVDYFPTLGALKRGSVAGHRLVALEKLISGARYDAERVFNGLAFRPASADEAEMYADYNAATRAGRLDYEEVLVAIALGLKFNPLDW